MGVKHPEPIFFENKAQKFVENANFWLFPSLFASYTGPLGGFRPSCHQPFSRKVQIRQPDQGKDLGGILHQSTVAHLGETKLAFHHAEDVFDPAAYG